MTAAGGDESGAGDAPGPGWRTASLPPAYDHLAPDGSEIRRLVGLSRANVAHFRLPSGATSRAVAHRTIEEFWYVTAGRGEIWLRQPAGDGHGDGDAAGEGDGDVDAASGTVVELTPGVSLAMPPGTHFQFRTIGQDPLEIVGFAVPSWPGEHEAYPVDGPWAPTPAAG